MVLGWLAPLAENILIGRKKYFNRLTHARGSETVHVIIIRLKQYLQIITSLLVPGQQWHGVYLRCQYFNTTTATFWAHHYLRVERYDHFKVCDWSVVINNHHSLVETGKLADPKWDLISARKHLGTVRADQHNIKHKWKSRRCLWWFVQTNNECGD